MLRTFLLLAGIAVSYCTRSQKPAIRWSDEFKLENVYNSNMKVFTADSSGVYLAEKGVVPPLITTARLLKLDKDGLNVVYTKIYAKEHKGKDFETFFAFRDKLVMITSEYHRKEKTLEIFAAEVNRSSGELTEAWRSIASIKKEERSQDIGLRVLPNADTTGFIIFSALVNDEKYSFQVQEFNKDLAAITQPISISNELLAKTYRLEDVLYTADRKIVLVGKVLVYPEGRKKAAFDPEIANYHIRVYDEHGNQVNEVNTNVNGRWLIRAKVLLTKNKELVLAGFYSNSRKIVADGLLVLRIDPSTGNVISAAEKELNYSVLTAEKDDDKGKDERKEDEAFSKNMTFRNIFHTADGGLVLLAENYKDDLIRPSPGYTFKYSGADLKNTYFDSDEIMMCKIDAGNNINWLHILPKMQRERTAKITSDFVGYINASPFFYELDLPYYSGFGAVQHNGKINIFFNDNPKNANVLKPGEKVYTAKRMGQTHCYRVTLDEVTGNYERHDFFDNAGVPAPMIRHAKVIGNEMYIMGQSFQQGMLSGKIKLQVGKITFE